jgi:hypothetical protein
MSGETVTQKTPEKNDLGDVMFDGPEGGQTDLQAALGLGHPNADFSHIPNPADALRQRDEKIAEEIKEQRSQLPGNEATGEQADGREPMRSNVVDLPSYQKTQQSTDPSTAPVTESEVEAGSEDSGTESQPANIREFLDQYKKDRSGSNVAEGQDPNVNLTRAVEQMTAALRESQQQSTEVVDDNAVASTTPTIDLMDDPRFYEDPTVRRMLDPSTPAVERQQFFARLNRKAAEELAESKVSSLRTKVDQLEQRTTVATQAQAQQQKFMSELGAVAQSDPWAAALVEDFLSNKSGSVLGADLVAMQKAGDLDVLTSPRALRGWVYDHARRLSAAAGNVVPSQDAEPVAKEATTTTSFRAGGASRPRLSQPTQRGPVSGTPSEASFEERLRQEVDRSLTPASDDDFARGMNDLLEGTPWHQKRG